MKQWSGSVPSIKELAQLSEERLVLHQQSLLTLTLSQKSVGRRDWLRLYPALVTANITHYPRVLSLEYFFTIIIFSDGEPDGRTEEYCE
jgi:hypothetical protein